MKKIEKDRLLKSFNYSKIINENGYIDNMSDESIIEISIGNKYYYKLCDSSPFLHIHNKLCTSVLNLIPLNNAAVAYRVGISYLNLFEPHQHGYYFLRLDISSFFYSINDKLLKKCFSRYFEDQYIDDKENQTLLDAFITSVTYKIPKESHNERFRDKVVLPIGFKTSPMISNIVFRKLDILIQTYCSSKNIQYSRYSDDMLFSSPSVSSFIHSESFISEIKYLLSLDNFKINKRKTIKAKHTISLNGYVISRKDYSSQNAYIHISNKKTKIIEKTLYMLKNKSSEEVILRKLFGLRVTHKFFKYLPPDKEYLKKYCRDQLFNKLAGYRAFILSIIKFDNKYQCVDPKALEKYARIIEKLNKYMDELDRKN